MKEKENTNVPLVIGDTKSLKPFKRSTCCSDFKIKAKFEKSTLRTFMRERNFFVAQFAMPDFI